MKLLITVIVTFFAGMGAGLGTGFAGMSAAAVISPMLITFLGMDPYAAVGIALASDVLASAVSAYTYGKSKNLDIRNGIIMMATVLAFTVVGNYGQLLGHYDLPARSKIYRSPRHDHQGGNGGRIGKKARDTVGRLRRGHRAYLRLCRRGRRYDDAAYPDLCARL